MEATCPSETSVATEQTTRRHFQEDNTLYVSKIHFISISPQECCKDPHSEKWDNNNFLFFRTAENGNRNIYSERSKSFIRMFGILLCM
jgi:hypothetical protein